MAGTRIPFMKHSRDFLKIFPVWLMVFFFPVFIAFPQSSDTIDVNITSAGDSAIYNQSTVRDLQKPAHENSSDQKGILLAAGISALLFLALAFAAIRAVNRRKKSDRELQKAQENLNRLQKQLIETEKLASLGQLTAGIAHEIKNPLNFVNNFSILSEELLADLKTAETEEERNEIIDDLTQNLKKISQHGKRADSIVKNMLQHSRGESSEKQLTDINALCSEFIDLAYHGMRATHADFNCRMVKEFQPGIKPVNIISQDVGRVLLNIFNNAFYALDKKSKAGMSGYEPELTVKTETKDNRLIISIRDNGTGIPDPVRKKIFEPFFTTKATGEGTGLGLSISNDIIRAHGGEMKVESEENAYTEFRIILPVVS